jgi:phenylalanine-4-hydroxylase
LLVPWFPIHISDLDKFNNETMEYSDDLEIDHPGFTDPVYRKRRTDIVKLAKEYNYGQKISTVQYTDVENSTWETVYTTLRSLTPSHAWLVVWL